MAGGVLPQGGLAFRLLGEVTVTRDGQTLTVSAHKPRLLLALLAAQANEVIPAERLIDRLWPQAPPASAQTLLHGYVSDLRRLLEPDRPRHAPARVLRRRHPGYVLVCGPRAVDVPVFERLISDGHEALRRGDAETARHDLAGALALWRGGPFGSLAAEPALAPEVVRLEQLQLAAIEGRLKADLALGRDAELVDELEGLIARHPLRERLWCALMLALYRSGRQADALAAYRRAADVLREQLGVDPGPELVDTQRAVLRHEARAEHPDATGRPRPAPPPRPLAGLVGRQDQLQRLREALDEHRLLTLTGTGGCGKTRLAVELAWSLDDPGRVVWTDLASVRDPEAVAVTAAAALALVEQPGRELLDALVAQVADRELLLVLDNCEHVLAGCRRLAAALLQGCANVRILATSRTPLGVPGEARWRVPPLSVASEDADVDDIAAAEAVELFVARAREARPQFTLSATTADDVAAICRRTEGIPLAIELAAAWMSTLSPRQIREQLDDPLGFLSRGSRAAPARQHTLRAAIGWSFALLGEAERSLFSQLSVFAGPFSLEAATSVAWMPPADPARSAGERWRQVIMTGLADLEAASLIVAEHPPEGPVRYRLLDTLRQFGAEQLAAAGLSDAVGKRHADYVHGLAHHAARGLYGPDLGAWLARLDAELPEVRKALDWLLSAGRAEAALDICGWLARYWMARAHIAEGRRWLSRALRADEGRSPASRVRALLAAAFLACMHYDLDDARDRAGEALLLVEAARNQTGILWAHNYLGLAATMGGDAETAAAHHERSLTCVAERDDALARAWTLNFFALAHQVAGRHDEQRTALEESLRLCRALGDQAGIEWALGFLGSVTFILGDADRAERRLRESLEIARGVGDQWGLARSLAAVALAAGPSLDGRRQMRESIETFGRLGDRAGVAFCLRAIASWGVGGSDQRQRSSLAEVAEAIGADVHHVPILGHLAHYGTSRRVDRSFVPNLRPAPLSKEPTIEEAVEAGIIALADLVEAEPAVS